MLATRAFRQLGLVRNAKNAIPATPARVIARRRISSTPRRWSDKDSNPLQQTELGARNKAAVGVFTPTAAIIFATTGLALFYYFKYEKEQLQEKKRQELESRAVGRAHVGGPFSLVTHDDKPFTEQNLKGQWTLLYFGFTNCPDICPAELDKMGEITDTIEKKTGTKLQPVFISVDPARDSQAQIARYLQDFHPRFVGLTGTYDVVKKTCKEYRVYFSTPPSAKADDDYLVDHSIFVYLMDPDGVFVEAFGQVSTVPEVVERTERELAAWKKESGREA